MKLEKANVEVVNWILDFIAVDLDTISDFAFTRHVLEAQYYFYDQWVGKWLDPRELGSGENDQLAKKKAPAEKKFRIMTPLWQPENYPWRETLEKMQVSLKGIAKELSESQPGRQGVIRKVEGVSLVFERGPKGMSIQFNPLSNISDLQIPEPEELVRLANRTFYISANGLPQDAIISCRECNRYVLHLSKKVKYFCSQRCASRYLSRERREKDPEGYRATQREIMRRKYKKKKAEELGRPVEKIVIQKRSISKKGK